MQQAIEQLHKILGLLEEADERFDKEPPSRGAYNARFGIDIATKNIRFALSELSRERKATCNKP